MIPIWKSRKFWIAVVAVLVIVLRSLVPNFPIDDEAVSKIVLALVGWSLGIALEDAGAKAAG